MAFQRCNAHIIHFVSKHFQLLQIYQPCKFIKQITTYYDNACLFSTSIVTKQNIWNAFPNTKVGNLNFKNVFLPPLVWATSVTMPINIGELTNHDMLDIWILYGNAPTNIPLF
jgi:hypothetical protein